MIAREGSRYRAIEVSDEAAEDRHCLSTLSFLRALLQLPKPQKFMTQLAGIALEEFTEPRAVLAREHAGAPRIRHCRRQV